MEPAATADDRVLIDWRNAGPYSALLTLGGHAFAWEWLRRNARYRAAWRARKVRGPSDAPNEAMTFGLVAMVDPSLPAPFARPIWRADVDRSVLVAEVLDADAPAREGLDLLAVASVVTLEIGANEDQHLLLSDGRASIRLDIVRGTLLGGRALLSYRLWGAARLRTPLIALRRLIALVLTGCLPPHLFPPERAASRWILELRVADALRAGASHRSIAQTLFGTVATEDNWRGAGDSVRSRVQRLVRTARIRMRDGAHLDFLEQS